MSKEITKEHLLLTHDALMKMHEAAQELFSIMKSLGWRDADTPEDAGLKRGSLPYELFEMLDATHSPGQGILDCEQLAKWVDAQADRLAIEGR